MNLFLNQVRKSQIPHPTQSTFTLEKWNEAFNAVNSPSDMDTKLFHSGIWIYKRLEKIRSKVDEVLLRNVPKEQLLRLLCGVLNRTSKIMSEIEPPVTGENYYIAEQLIQAKTPTNTPNPEAHPDMILTAEVDAIRFPLIYATKIEHVKSSSSSDRDVINSIRKIMFLGQSYYSAEGIWMECLWHNSYIETGEGIEFVEYSDIEFVLNLAVSEYRRQALTIQRTNNAVIFWKSGLSEEAKRKLSFRSRVKIAGAGKRRRFKVWYSESSSDPPMTLIQKIVAQETYFQELTKLELSKFFNLTIEQFLSAWDLLFSLAEEFMEKFPNDSSFYSLGKLMQYAPTIKKKDVAQLFSELLDINKDTAVRLVEVFSFKPTTRSELWTHPLVAINEEKMVLVLSPVLYGNPLRAIEFWLKEGGINLTAKGPLFENYAREEIARAINSSKILKNAYIHSSNIRLLDSGNEEEIDIVMRIGNTILVGEARCVLFPSEPLEVHNYFEILRGAVEQIKRKTQVASNNMNTLLDVLDLKDKINAASRSINVIPFILTNLPMGVGFPMDDVAIIDLYILCRYLDEGIFEKFVSLSPTGKKTVGETLHFYSNEVEAEQNIQDYLKNPPQINLYKPFLKKKIFPMLKLDDKEIGSAHIQYTIELPIPEYKV